MEKDQLLRQIEHLKAMGFGGFHMHSRTGLATEYLSDEFMEMVKTCCDKAEQEHMLAWLMMKIGGPPARQAALETHRTVRVLHKQGHTDMRIIYNYRQDNDCRWLFIACCDEFGGDAHSAPQRDVIFDETITIIVKGEFIPTQYDTLDGTIKPLSYIHKNGNTVQGFDERLFHRCKRASFSGYSKAHIPEVINPLKSALSTA